MGEEETAEMAPYMFFAGLFLLTEVTGENPLGLVLEPRVLGHLRGRGHVLYCSIIASGHLHPRHISG